MAQYKLGNPGWTGEPRLAFYVEGNVTTYTYFQGKILESGRLGSMGAAFNPYGAPKTALAEGDGFATYWRDQKSGLDYAINRYYHSALGRFVSPDPYMASGGPGVPQSWNRYAYVEGDPVNYYDPGGLIAQCPPGTRTGSDGKSCIQVPPPDSLTIGRPPGRTIADDWADDQERQIKLFEECQQESAPEMEEGEWQDFFGNVEMDIDELLELATPLGSDKGPNPVLPAFAVAAATAANWVVYYARTPQGQYYIGVTSNYIAREAQHLSRFRIQAITGLPKMNYAAAKGVEQLLIENIRRSGGSLLNKINSISPKNPYYKKFTDMGHDILNKCSAAGLALPPGM
jgi:RHS repeat-associated protein